MKLIPWLVAGLLASTLPRSGDRIVYIAKDGLHVMGADGSGDTRVDTGKLKEVLEAVPSPDGSRLAFSAGRMPTDIWIVDIDGRNLRNLTSIKGFSQSASRPSWSPDGKKVAYLLGEMFKKDIWTVKADGSEPKNLSNGGTALSDYRWSPDGAAIAYVQQDAVTEGGSTSFQLEDLWSVAGDGTGKRRLTQTPDRKETGPAWSPDGGRLLFTAQEVTERKENLTILGGEEIWVMDADGNGAKNLSNNEKGEDHFASWSPDGKRIAFVARKDGGPGAIYVMAADGTGAKALREPAWGNEYRGTEWSSDGTRILTQDGHDKVAVFEADGSARTEPAKGRTPRWVRGK